jgi:predicted DNA-binding transcriptional regulator YafY
LAIMSLLQVRGRVSAQQLAEELEVSLRTVYRDIEALSAAGVPVYAVRGRAGGFALVSGYRPGLSGLTGLIGDEADALFLTGLPGPAAELGLGSVLAATEVKLLAALPPPLRERASRIRDRFHLDAPGWLRDPEAPPALTVIADAAWAERRLSVRYERTGGVVVDRVLDPLGVVLKAGTWYLVALADGSSSARTYRVSRIRDVTTLDETFERPTGFDLREHWDSYQRDYAERVYRERATVRLSPAGRELLFLVGPIAARAARAAMRPPDEDGWAITTVPIESVRHGVHALLQLSGDVEVLGPPALREQMTAAVQALAAHYDVSQRAAPAASASG